MPGRDRSIMKRLSKLISKLFFTDVGNLFKICDKIFLISVEFFVLGDSDSNVVYDLLGGPLLILGEDI